MSAAETLAAAQADLAKAREYRDGGKVPADAVAAQSLLVIAGIAVGGLEEDVEEHARRAARNTYFNALSEIRDLVWAVQHPETVRDDPERKAIAHSSSKTLERILEVVEEAGA